jgi:hypothetical protein
VSASASWSSRPEIVARESCSRSPRPTVFAVTSAVDSCRERTSAIEEKEASASPSLALGISSSNEAPASPSPPSSIADSSTIPS